MTSRTLDNYIGLNIGHHDSSVCFLQMGKDIQVTIYEEERFSRVKGRGFFPYCAINRLLAEKDISLVPLQNVAVTNFLHTIEQDYEGIQKRTSLFADFIEKNNLQLFTLRNKDLFQVPHHEAHLFSVLPLIQDEQALIVVADGCGSSIQMSREIGSFPYKQGGNVEGHENISVYLKKGTEIVCVKKIPTLTQFDTRTGLKLASEIYNNAAKYIFGDWKHCGKLMGLSSYAGSERIEQAELIEILENYKTVHNFTKEEFDQLDSNTFSTFARIAAATQDYFENSFRALFFELKREYPEIENLIFTGGSALNCLFNAKLFELELFKKFFVPAFPNDEGVSLGAALACAYRKGQYQVGKQFLSDGPFMGSTQSLGSDENINEKFKDFHVHTFKDRDYRNLAKLISQGEVVAWVSGRSECGPRALGHRSLYASPFLPRVKQILNDQFKKREAFRPYGISILKEDVTQYFDCRHEIDSPYMSFAPRVKNEFRGLFCEIMQPDQTIRIQTVTNDNFDLYQLLISMKKETGHGVVVHTSLNIMGEPIIETLNDAFRFFKNTDIRLMVMGKNLISKNGIFQ